MISVRELKQMPKEVFLALPEATEQLYNDLHNAKEGFIYVERERDGLKRKGHTWAFGEGVSCRMDTIDYWWCTSVVQKINWKEGYFDTLNSRYKFKFIEDEKNEENKESTENVPC